MAINYADKYQKAVIDGFYPDVLYSSALWQSPSNKDVLLRNQQTTTH